MNEQESGAEPVPPRAVGDHPLDLPLIELASGLRSGEFSALDITTEAVRRHELLDAIHRAYQLFDPESALRAARAADETLQSESDPGPMCGMPVSVKDLYGVEGWPISAGSSRPLPPGPWSRDAWLVARLREQGAVLVGKTHTVEFAYGGVGINPNTDTPRNPWDRETHRVPGGSSSGAGTSLAEGSAVVALGSDTGGSVRIPASLTGVVGMRGTIGRWSTAGVVPLSPSLDVVGALTRSVIDQAYFFGAVDPEWGNAGAFLMRCLGHAPRRRRLALPECGIWNDTQADIERSVRRAVDRLAHTGWEVSRIDGSLLDGAARLYLGGGIPGAELIRFLDGSLPGRRELLSPLVASRFGDTPAVGSDRYRVSIAKLRRLAGRADELFASADLLVLPTHLSTPPPVAGLASDLDRYVEVNAACLRPTCAASVLGLTAITLPCGLDDAGMPVGLQLVGRSGHDVELLAAAVAAESVLGGIGRPSPGVYAPVSGSASRSMTSKS